MGERRPLATSAEVAEYLGVPPRTVDTWAYFGRGPRYSLIGRHRRYRWDDVEAYVDEQVRTSGDG
jgi:excisionase family DNA binding protein